MVERSVSLSKEGQCCCGSCKGPLKYPHPHRTAQAQHPHLTVPRQVWLVNLHKALADSFGSNWTAPDSAILSSPRLRLCCNSSSDPRPISGPAAIPQQAPVTSAVNVAGQGRLRSKCGVRILIADDDMGQVGGDHCINPVTT